MDLMDGMQQLLAREQIRDVLSRYARAIDRLDWDLMRSCYHEDATDDHGVVSGSLDEFITFFEVAMLDFDATFHFIGNVVIDLVAPDTATAETYCVASHWFTRDDEQMLLETGVRYVDRFVDRGDGFRIERRFVILDWVRNGPADTSWRYGSAFPRGGRLPDHDPSFTVLKPSERGAAEFKEPAAPGEEQ